MAPKRWTYLTYGLFFTLVGMGIVVRYYADGDMRHLTVDEDFIKVHYTSSSESTRSPFSDADTDPGTNNGEDIPQGVDLHQEFASDDDQNAGIDDFLPPNTETESDDSSSAALDKPKIVIVLGYMHTGSSYLAELIHRHPGTFYEFEPLRHIKYTLERGRPLYYLNGTARFFDDKVMNKDVVTSAIHDMVTCNHAGLDIGTLTNYYFGAAATEHKDAVPYLHCLAGHNRTVLKYHTTSFPLTFMPPEKIRECIPTLTKTCSGASLRLTKYIRLSMDALVPILENLDNVKVIHLLRDPRSVLDSEHRKKEMDVSKFAVFEERSKYMCGRMREDFELAERLKTDLPGVIRTVRYEDMADRPLEFAKEIFKFIGVKFDQLDEDFVNEKSIAAKVNSTALASVWRRHIDLQHLEALDRHCSDIYEKLGYVRFKTIEDVQNLALEDHVELFRFLLAGR